MIAVPANVCQERGKCNEL